MIKDVIQLFKDIKDNKAGLEEREKLRPKLSKEENELIDAVLDMLAHVANWAAEQTLCAAGILVEADESDKDRCLFKALKICAKFNINPMLVVKFVQDIDMEVDPGVLLQAISEEEIEGMANGDENAMQKELDEICKKFRQN